ncbi:hypothetical protein CPLU01_01942 [Colletotrichum plurivorum]|uniref:Uncharacterized protein n=1 Tax=Colletotrichum plurivorum TaxID=2175906 RepID=A0A8H6KWZ4_9PEZI|nr:hypothetical protein CPLU01_01942 [Colletotrichum plurivorum]
MCNYIFTVHSDCSHKQYQNTFKCPEARGSALFQSYSNLTLSQTMHLPASTPKQIPEPLCSGQIRNAVRPVTGLCRACIREEREKQQKLDAQRAHEETSTATRVRQSILGLEQLVAATKPLDLDE